MKQNETLRMTDNAVCEKQLTEHARQHLVHAFVRLLNASPDDGLHWTGTKTDLLEAAHIVFSDGSATMSWGKDLLSASSYTAPAPFFTSRRPPIRVLTSTAPMLAKVRLCVRCWNVIG